MILKLILFHISFLYASLTYCMDPISNPKELENPIKTESKLSISEFIQEHRLPLSIGAGLLTISAPFAVHHFKSKKPKLYEQPVRK